MPVLLSFLWLVVKTGSAVSQVLIVYRLQLPKKPRLFV